MTHYCDLFATVSILGRAVFHCLIQRTTAALHLLTTNQPTLLLQPPNYLIIIVNRITYSINRITKNKSRMPLDLYIKLGPSKFSLQASVDHHGYSMISGHYTASINCCGKTFHCNDNKITECNITDTYNSSTAYILLYKLMLC